MARKTKEENFGWAKGDEIAFMDITLCHVFYARSFGIVKSQSSFLRSSSHSFALLCDRKLPENMMKNKAPGCGGGRKNERK